MLNRKSFSRKLANETSLTYEDSERFCKALFKCLAKTLWKENEDVMITGFGAFRHKKIRQKRIRHPSTGEFIDLPEKTVVRFYPSEMFVSLEKNGCIENVDDEADNEEADEEL